MAQQSTVVGWYNFPITPSQYTAGTASAVLVPSASGIYPGIPSPEFPLSTLTFPDALNISVPPELNPAASNAVVGATSVFDGHPFEVRASVKITAPAGNTSLLLNLYQATNAALAGGPSSAAYAPVIALSGTGVSKMTTGTSTAVGASTSAVFTMQSQFIWDSVSKTLNVINAPTQWMAGTTISTAATTTSVTGLSNVDLNFYLGVTFSTTLPVSCTLTEFVISRL
jgi:hypothetical protein